MACSCNQYLQKPIVRKKESKPLTIMTSYNLLNKDHTSARKDLLKTLLREEWGYEGLAMTDWVTQSLPQNHAPKYEMANAPGAIAAGNDLMMPGEKVDLEDLLNALHEEVKGYRVNRENLEYCATYVLELVWHITQAKGEKK